MSVRENLKNHALRFSQKAMERLLSDEGRAVRFAQAVGAAQKGREALNQHQDGLMRAVSLAPKSDFKALGKRLSAIKRRARELDAKLDALISR